jgi:hypothetical protein
MKMSSFKHFLLITILLFSLSEVFAETGEAIQPEKYRIGATKIESQIKLMKSWRREIGSGNTGF